MSVLNTLEITNKLKVLENKYGGITTGIIRNVKSPHELENYHTVHRGGDRMTINKYADLYAKYMHPHLSKKVLMVEIGILTGIGLAIWCDLFNDASVFGFDIDITNYEKNVTNLEKLGAFTRNKPRVYPFDQYVSNTEYLMKLFNGLEKTVDVIIITDDGCHEDNAIFTTIKSLMPIIADKSFIYFIEDNATVHKKISKQYPNLSMERRKNMTILTPKIL